MDESEAVCEGWSEVKTKAWLQRHKNPNAYYYRFNEPGEKQKVGPWSEEEKASFLKKLEEMGGSATHNWGIFSISLPGRVGYQCAAFYRKLVRDGEIKDDNYKFDEKGKIVKPPRKPKVIKKKRDSGSITPDEDSNSSSAAGDTDSNKHSFKSGPSEMHQFDLDRGVIKCEPKFECFRTSRLPVLILGAEDSVKGTLYLGCPQTAANKTLISTMGIRTIINCSGDLSNQFQQDFFYEAFPLGEVVDEHFSESLLNIAHSINSHLSSGQTVLIYCTESRMVSTSAIVAYLLAYHRLCLYDASDKLFSRDSTLKVDVAYLSVLKTLEEDIEKQNTKEMCDLRTPKVKTQMCNIFPKQGLFEPYTTDIIQNIIENHDSVYGTWYLSGQSTPAEIYHSFFSFDIIEGFYEDVC